MPGVVASTLMAAFVGAGCSGEARAVRLPARNPGEQIYQIDCRKSIDRCRDMALETCAGPYATLATNGTALEPPRVTTAPGPSSTGPRYRRMKWVGQMIVVCESEPSSAEPARGAVEHERETSAPPTLGQVCVPGATQACLGPGACRGAQACMATGRAYGPCDCGSPPSPARSTTSAVLDGGAPRPTTSHGDAGTP